MADWSAQAISIAERFDALIIPLYAKASPGTKLNPTKTGNKDLPPEKLPSSDPDIIRRWATYHPGYGVVPSDKFLILDVDVKENQNGKASLKFLIEKGLPASTFAVKSPSGGLHLYYKHPNHYKPAQSVGTTIRFEHDIDQEQWHLLQAESGKATTGLDTRYGWGYVAGPGSEFDGDSYVTMCTDDLADIPSSMMIGVGGKVKKKEPKKKEEKEPEFGSIKHNRNDHARDYTCQLSGMDYPVNVIKALLNNAIKWYNNEDGGAPTFDELFNMWERAKEKFHDGELGIGQDIVDEMMKNFIYISTGKRVLDEPRQHVTLFDDLVPEFSNQKVFINNSDKPLNPIKAWLENPDRRTVTDIMFDTRFDHGQIVNNTNIPLYNTFKKPTLTTESDYTPSDLGLRMYEAAISTIHNILPDKYERDLFVAWIALLVIKPEIRLVWHWHIYSDVQGVGKDVTAGLISMLFGEDNVKRINLSVFMDKSNTDLYNTGLAIMSDFSGATRKQNDVHQRYKEVTGADFGSQRRLYHDAVQASLSIRFLMFTNHEADFPVEKRDRRTFKSHCTSDRLDPEVGGLASLLIGSFVNQDLLDKYNMNGVTDEDRAYAKSKLYDYLLASDYKSLSHDCPPNRTKEESLIIDTPVYTESIIRAINSKSFVFASDIISEHSIVLMMNHLRVNTSVGSVLSTLLEAGIIRRINILAYKKDPNKGTIAKKVDMQALRYDEDLRMILPYGAMNRENIYCVRNFDKWTVSNNHTEDRRKSNVFLMAPLPYGAISKEYCKIFNYPNIMDGYSERTAALLSKNKVVTLYDDDEDDSK